MVKDFGYILFAFFFHIFRIFPVSKNKVFMVATHDAGKEGNIGVLSMAIKKYYPEKKKYLLKAEDSPKNFFKFFILNAYRMATSGYIIMDNMFLPMAYLHFSKEVEIVQLWHGTGTIKKFGQDVNKGHLRKLEKKINNKTSFFTVNSYPNALDYESAFGVPFEKLKITGLPRSDLFLSKTYIRKARERFFAKYPELEGKKLVLYAPTFRDKELKNPRFSLDLYELNKNLKDDEVFMLRLHPFVAGNICDDFSKFDKIVDMSSFRSVSTLLMVSDILITDYSSIIYEYVLTMKPIIFYPYDLEHFRKSDRGFYRNYEEFVPGTIIKNEKEICDAIRSAKADKNKDFIEKEFAYTDKCSTKRVLDLLFKA